MEATLFEGCSASFCTLEHPVRCLTVEVQRGICNGPWVLSVDLLPWRKKEPEAFCNALWNFLELLGMTLGLIKSAQERVAHLLRHGLGGGFGPFLGATPHTLWSSYFEHDFQRSLRALSQRFGLRIRLPLRWCGLQSTGLEAFGTLEGRPHRQTLMGMSCCWQAWPIEFWAPQWSKASRSPGGGKETPLLSSRSNWEKRPLSATQLQHLDRSR